MRAPSQRLCRHCRRVRPRKGAVRVARTGPYRKGVSELTRDSARGREVLPGTRPVFILCAMDPLQQLRRCRTFRLDVSLLLLGGLALSPICACLCDSVAYAAKAADQARGHAHTEPDGAHECGESAEQDCEHARCVRLSADLPGPSIPLLSDPRMSAPVPSVPADEEVVFRRGRVRSSHPDRGPPIPLPLYSILRP